jgi:hypothetical protein
MPPDARHSAQQAPPPRGVTLAGKAVAALGEARREAHRALAAVAPQPDEPPDVLVDAPRLPAGAPRWRQRLFFALHTRRHHAFVLGLIVLAISVNVTGVLLSLFTCEAAPGERVAARRAADALRWVAVSLLCAQLTELLTRAAVVGPPRFLRVPIHALDAAVIVSLLAAELVMSSTGARDAVGLLVAVRILRMARLLRGLHAYEAEAHAAVLARERALTAHAASLEAALLLRAEKTGVCAEL